MASGSYEDEIARLRSFFRSSDENKDGKVTKQELENYLQTMNSDSETVKYIMEDTLRVADTDGNGVFDLEDFLSLAEKGQKDAKWKKAFQDIDKNGNGFITGGELRQSMVKNGIKTEEIEKAVDSMFMTADKDEDSQISYEEFREMMG